MITVEEARSSILKQIHPLEPEAVGLLDALDRVLVEDIRSNVDVPPHANSAMDGYAVRGIDIAGAVPGHPVTLQVVADLAAGYVPTARVGPGEAIRIMTGAVLPAGADTVIRFEDTSEAVGLKATGKGQGTVEIQMGAPLGANVRAPGEDIRSGTVVLKKGTVVRPAEIGVLASLGIGSVSVHRRPRVAILATGDELVEIGEPLAPGKIRNSNEWSNAAAVKRAGGLPIPLGIARDRIEDLTAKLHLGLDSRVDLFITSAGVSVGDYDVVKDVLNREGEMHFWQVKMKPGKPLAFGIVRGVPLLGLPGNPVSALLSFEVFARPTILTMLGKTRLTRPVVMARIDEEVRNDAGRRNYIRVRVEREKGEYRAHTTGAQGSGILTSMVGANGLLVLPAELTLLPQGEYGVVEMLDWGEE